MTDIDRIDVITLDRTPERFATFASTNAHLPIRRFAAADGLLLDRWDCVDDGLITAGNPYRLGALGCAISHVTLWRHCIAEGRAFHIAEDDAIFRHDFIEVASATLRSLGGWDIVLWGWNFNWPIEVALGDGLGPAAFHCDQDRLRSQWNAFPASTAKPSMLRLTSCAGSWAYSISPRGARTLLEKSLPFAGAPAPFPGKPGSSWLNRSFDVEMSRHYASMQAYVAVPCLAVSLNIAAESTIASSA